MIAAVAAATLVGGLLSSANGSPAYATSRFQPQIHEPRITHFNTLPPNGFPECITSQRGYLWVTEVANWM